MSHHGAEWSGLGPQKSSTKKGLVRSGWVTIRRMGRPTNKFMNPGGQVSMIIMKYYEILWNIMKYYEILWNIMKYYEVLWSIMKYYEILWNIMKYYEILGNIRKY